MMEGLARQRSREARAANVEFAVHGLSIYGLVMALAQVNAPASVTLPAVLVLAAASVHRWLERRWAVERLDPQS